MTLTAPGAVAFSRTGDPSVGDFEDAVVIERFGQMPSITTCWLDPGRVRARSRRSHGPYAVFQSRHGRELR